MRMYEVEGAKLKLKLKLRSNVVVNLMMKLRMNLCLRRTSHLYTRCLAL